MSSTDFSASNMRRISNSRGLSASTAEGSPARRLMASSWSMSGLSAMRPALTSAIARSSASRRVSFCPKAARARLDGLDSIGGALMHGKDEDARGAVPLPDAPDRLHPANARHRYVHDDEIGPRLLVDAIGLGPVARLGDDTKAVLLLQQRAIALAHDRMVVRQHHARKAAAAGHAQSSCPTLGMVATSLVPPVARRSNRSVPPSEATRSCMPRSPMPAFGAGSTVASPSSSMLKTMSACPVSRRSCTRLA